MANETKKEAQQGAQQETQQEAIITSATSKMALIKAENKNLTDGYVGTYYSEKSKGIYHFTFDSENGTLTEPELFYEAHNAKWVCLNGSSMAFPIEKQGKAGICFLELKEGKIGHAAEILEEKQTPCYILWEDDYVYTANYHEGNVMVYHLKKGMPSLIKRIENGDKAGCHQILLHESHLMVPCLEQNRIRLFDIQHDYIPAGEIIFPDGTGPRHGIFNRRHTMFYVVSEWSNELFVFSVHGSGFTLVQTLSVLPVQEHNKNRDAAAAAIRMSTDERFLYVSVRGIDTLTVFDISGSKAAIIQHISCGGVHPRDFILSGNETYLLVANSSEGGIVSMERDAGNGLLKNPLHSVPMPEGVSLTLAAMKER